MSDICKATSAAGDVAVYEVAHRQLKDFTEYYNRHLAEPENARLIKQRIDVCLETYCGENIKPERKGNGCKIYIGERYVVKISPLYYMGFDNIADDPAKEATFNRIFCKYGNPALLRCVAAFPLGNYYVSVTPTATQGTLLSFLLDGDSDKSLLRGMFSTLLHGVAFMHHNRIAHNDLKLENLLINKLSQLIIADYGVAIPVANPPREYALQRAWQHKVQRLQRAGASAVQIEAHKAACLQDFDTEYDRCAQQHNLLSAILNAPTQDVDGLIDQLDGVKMPLSWCFSPRRQALGFTAQIVRSIDGYSDPNDPSMHGEALVNSFLTQLRRIPDEAARKQVLRNTTARLLPGLDPELYRLASKPEIEIPAAPIQGARGTGKYMCPVLDHELPADPFAADIYSLGVTLFCMATGIEPYGEKFRTEPAAYLLLKNHGVGQLLRRYEEMGAIPRDAVTPECLALLEKMMSFNPAARPTIDECIELFKNVQLKNYC